MKSKRLPSNQIRRGDIRLILLGVLAIQPRHGYDIMNHLERKSGGAWRPSPGVVYPMLRQLEDEGLVVPEKVGGKTVYHVTEKGRAEVARHRIPGPWKTDEEMFRHVAWAKEMASQLTHAYLKMIQVANPARVEALRNEVEAVIETISQESRNGK